MVRIPRDIFTIMGPMLTGIGVFVFCVLLTSVVAQSRQRHNNSEVAVPIAEIPDSLARHAERDHRLMSATEAEAYGHGGRRSSPVAYSDAMPASFLHTAPNRILQADILEPAFALLDAGERPLRIYHLGDSHVAGRAFPTAVRDELETVWGNSEHPRRGQGLTFRYAGRNGAQSFHLVERGYLREVETFEPDVLIVSLGTNEAHGRNYDESSHRQQLDAFMVAVRRACPRAAILMTTPPGDYFRRKPNPALPRCVSLIAEYCGQNGLACWNLWQVCGGESALDNYRSLSLQRPDGVHFTPEGYNLHGRLLAQAILAAYNGER